jgi:hypothetical protein
MNEDTCMLTGSTSQALAAHTLCTHSSLCSSSRHMHRRHQSATWQQKGSNYVNRKVSHFNNIPFLECTSA